MIALQQCTAARVRTAGWSCQNPYTPGDDWEAVPAGSFCTYTATEARIETFQPA